MNCETSKASPSPSRLKMAPARPLLIANATSRERLPSCFGSSAPRTKSANWSTRARSRIAMVYRLRFNRLIVCKHRRLRNAGSGVAGYRRIRAIAASAQGRSGS